jgi:hypothetical protein
MSNKMSTYIVPKKYGSKTMFSVSAFNICHLKTGEALHFFFHKSIISLVIEV